MQQFKVTLCVTVNTIEPVTEPDLREELQELASEFEGGTIDIHDIIEA